jgi:hypothetical protein
MCRYPKFKRRERGGIHTESRRSAIKLASAALCVSSVLSSAVKNKRGLLIHLARGIA